MSDCNCEKCLGTIRRLGVYHCPKCGSIEFRRDRIDHPGHVSCFVCHHYSHWTEKLADDVISPRGYVKVDNPRGPIKKLIDAVAVSIKLLGYDVDDKHGPFVMRDALCGEQSIVYLRNGKVFVQHALTEYTLQSLADHASLWAEIITNNLIAAPLASVRLGAE